MENDYIQAPVVEIKQDQIIFHNLRRADGTQKVVMSVSEAALYYIELHKFIISKQEPLVNNDTTT